MLGIQNCFVRLVCWANEAGVSSDTGSLIVHGGVGVTAAVHCDGVFSTSDQRLKQDIQELQDSRGVLRALRPCTYTWRDLDVNVGILAQSVPKNVPNCVHVDHNGTQSVNYAKLIPYLVQRMTELDHKVEALAAKNGIN